ncbi:PREDICTED: transcription factor TFIIIB component B'' homolog [Vollenhovia emeryi]|uniref:transcription factor TFIIIB component B'' homolog n=1 Tax=Vollenhovia emeryi TaxID=411798 RepID=UPI0005F401A7|nr:PREDICTED: transcription factor TFIIIB component B'' homolog [Vollenhovia emeryi]XP_011877368.1 PREDICTED: transcription factor TFIIIB component B'' homolog [Vollenhovia emeryi]XP_011877369.1 PREDICTED: transcription factor TFIIIB component B'' homolog [Vollenhovia emeryi]XP_011877370.1 PREDICTED: transcription factor TFIIIB component B'' homolog [Vollenhovia emeryi]XP_011877371.1 PREDICTED: transcription factor TFIIIB component B'' homolog [Vollenhovia emeryi]
MRRARIKALAAVPVRKKPLQDSTDSIDANDASDKEKKNENISNIHETEQVASKEAAKVEEQKKDDAATINIFEQKEQEKEDRPNIGDQLVQNCIPLPDVPTVTDIASPTKQSRPCFMRPTPRLDSGGRIRKNSIQGSGASASESEDEHSKRVQSVVPSRVRNDSVCSVQSNKESTTNDNQNSPSKFKTTQKRRMLVSESARKLAEARREFLLKHENRTPERSQLKMYDLIYYNPVTNPMKKMPVERRQVSTTPQPVEVPEEEEEDDPSAMSTPQVKVGPDGQLIIDEQSLVIEHTDAKREEEILASGVTIEDENTHGGGFYKKHKRSKEWPKWETFKFYRVLNVVGTDFLLMQTLFPNRSRQEIKQKYKKEERVNRQLVEKALKYHQEFDTDLLEEQLAMLQKLENIPDTSKKPSEKVKNGQCLRKIDRKRKHRLVAESIGECEALSNDREAEDAEDTVTSMTNEIDTEINSDTNNTQQQMEKRSKTRKSKKRLNDKSEMFDDYRSYTDADSDSSEEIYQARPTRSGRLSKKIRKLQAPDFDTLNSDTGNESPVDDKSMIPSHIAVEVTEYVNTPVTNSENTETSCSDHIMTMIPNINQMEPGAVVIVSKESTENPGNTILQVYMVASNIDSTTTITPSAASGNKSSELLTTKSENVESSIVDDSD